MLRAEWRVDETSRAIQKLTHIEEDLLGLWNAFRRATLLLRWREIALKALEAEHNAVCGNDRNTDQSTVLVPYPLCLARTLLTTHLTSTGGFLVKNLKDYLPILQQVVFTLSITSAMLNSNNRSSAFHYYNDKLDHFEYLITNVNRFVKIHARKWFNKH